MGHCACGLLQVDWPRRRGSLQLLLLVVERKGLGATAVARYAVDGTCRSSRSASALSPHSASDHAPAWMNKLASDTHGNFKWSTSTHTCNTVTSEIRTRNTSDHLLRQVASTAQSQASAEKKACLLTFSDTCVSPAKNSVTMHASLEGPDKMLRNSFVSPCCVNSIECRKEVVLPFKSVTATVGRRAFLAVGVCAGKETPESYLVCAFHLSS